MKCLEITMQIGCKNNCIYCPQDILKANYKGPDKILEYSKFTSYLIDIPKEVKIHFSGMSEPFINDYLIFYMEWAYKKGHDIGLYTTLLDFSHYCIPKLKEIKVDPFAVHIPQNMNQNKVSNWCASFAIAEPFITEVIRVGHVKHDEKIEFLLRNSGATIVNQAIISRAGNLENVPYRYKTGKIKCRDNRQKQNVLMPNGDVVLCCMDYGQQHVLGNLNNCSYEELFYSDEYRKVLIGLEDDNIDILCRKCFRAENI